MDLQPSNPKDVEALRAFLHGLPEEQFIFLTFMVDLEVQCRIAQAFARQQLGGTYIEPKIENTEQANEVLKKFRLQ
jgi:hypothetical protein